MTYQQLSDAFEATAKDLAERTRERDALRELVADQHLLIDALGERVRVCAELLSRRAERLAEANKEP